MLLGKYMTGLKVDAKPTQAGPEMSDGKYFTCPLERMNGYGLCLERRGPQKK